MHVALVVATATLLTSGLWSASALAPAPTAPARAINAGNAGKAAGAVIVQAVPGHEAEAANAVRRAGGSVGQDLPLVDGFEATLTPAARSQLTTTESPIRAITANDPIRFEAMTYDATTTASNFAKTSNATAAWSAGGLGAGIGVAIIDTGVSSMNDFAGRLVFGPDLSGEGTTVDSFGHGTVMAGIVGGSGADSAAMKAAYTGVAPKATIVSVKVAGRNGVTDVSTVLQAMHWVAAYKDQFNIKVVNLSWGTTSTQDPRIDPLNYAVERLWQLGVVVVAAAGNSGPNAGTVLKPGDDPVVLTAGAYNDGGNLGTSDDSIPSWSSRGPTAQGLNKPDLVAPGRTLIATRSFGSQIESDNPKARVWPSYIKGSGTSEAAAVTSGLSALLVEKRPTLTPDQVKRALTASASPISGTPASVQGAGRVDLGGALAVDPGPASQQTLAATGLGSLEASRGGRNVQSDCNGDGTPELIQGEITDHCEAWDPAAWTGNSWTGNSWTGNSWTGNSWTGNSWTGNSWTNATWTGNSWTGGTWTGNSWTGNSWTGNSWTGNSWTGNSWTGNSWTGNSWTGNSWTSAEYDTDTTTATGFLSAFWGAHPKWWQSLPGEASDAQPGAAHAK